MAPNDRLESIPVPFSAETEPATVLGLYVPEGDEGHRSDDEYDHNSGEHGCRPDCAQCGCYPIS